MFSSRKVVARLAIASLALSILVPTEVRAAALTAVSAVPWSTDVSVTGKHTINFTTATTVPANGKIVITYPAGFDVSGATFDSWSGFDGGRSISIVGQVITITRDNAGTGSTGGAKYVVLNNITNNSAALTYTATVETRDGSNATLDGPTTSANFSITATNDGLDTTSPWPMRGHDNRNSFSSGSAGPDYPTLAWKFTYADGSFYNGAVEDSNGVIYIVGTANIYALNPDGATKWSVANSHSNPAGTILTKNGRLIIWYRSGGFVESRNVSDGSLAWTYTSPVGSTDAGSLSIGPDGSIFVATRTGGIEGINSDGTRKFYNPATDNRDSTPAVDNTTGQIYTFSDDSAKNYNPDGTIKWNNAAVQDAIGNPAQLTSNGNLVCRESRSTSVVVACLNTSDGSILWSLGNVSTGYGQGAFSPNDSIFYTMFNAASISARNAATGVANWTQSYTGGFGYAGGGNLMVDGNNRVYAGKQAFNPDGTSRWTLSSTGTPIPIIGTSNTMVYYDRSGNLYDYKPWTLSGSVATNGGDDGSTMNITATSSMLKRDPAASVDNQVQAIMANGDKVALTYDSVSGSNTVWKGNYVIPNGTTGGSKTVTIQAAAYNVTTDQTTTFASPPAGFNNSGITATVSTAYGSTNGGLPAPSSSPAPTPAPPQPTAGLSADHNSITLGQSATLTWTTTNANSVSIDQGVGSVALNGSATVTPAQTTTYTLTATGSGGTTTKSLTVTVNPVSPPSTPPSPQPQPPNNGTAPVPVLSYPPGTLVQQESTIYLVTAPLTAVGFTSWQAFVGLGYKLANVIFDNLSGYRIATDYFLSSPTQAHPWSSWVKSGRTIYYVSSQGLIGVPTWDILLSNGGEDKFILPANKADLQVLKANAHLPLLESNDSRVVR